MRPAPCARRPHPRRGFTLIEILMVIGIIAVLAGLLLTVRSRASDKATQAMCVSNLRQIGMAILMYAQENEQVFPLSSPLVPAGPSAPMNKGDWIYWRGTNLTQAINGSAIAPYVKAKGESFQALMRCPTDEWDNHTYPYPYSYSMNYMITPDASQNVAPQVGKPPTPRLSAFNRASEKIIAAEENERTINDGLWAPGNYTDPQRTNWVVNWDWLSVRHDTRKSEFIQPQSGTLAQQDKRGNVVFADGHADYVTRKFAHDPLHLLPNNEGTGKVPAPPAGG
jgi:prepilin-type N-terminal cleavage/methylation domain-containing protein/prepilin-type processing-associated H-X9-DG protein